MERSASVLCYLNRKWCWGAFLLVLVSGGYVQAREARAVRFNRRHLSVSGESARQKNLIKDVVVVAKRNHDFEYFSAIFANQKGFGYNQVGAQRYQRYIVGIDSNQQLSGTYAAVILSDSVKTLMGHANITVKYISTGRLRPEIETFFLKEQDVVDDRQIFVRLDTSCNMKKKIIAWEVTIRDEKNQKEYVQSSFVWKRLAPICH